MPGGTGPIKAGILVATVFACLGLWTSASAQELMPNGVVYKPAPFSDPIQFRMVEAACLGDIDGARRSLDEGASVEAEGQDGVTPLLWVLRCHSLDGVRLLLERGADPDRLLRGTPTSHYAARLEDVRFLELFLQYGADPNASRPALFGSLLDIALMRGIGEGTWGQWDLLLRSGVDINRPDHNGDTTAMKAARLNAYDRIIELLERGYSYDLPKLRQLTTSSVAVGNRVNDPNRLRLVAMLDERIGT